MDGLLIDNLSESLARYNVSVTPLPEESVLATLNELGRISLLSRFLGELLSSVKAHCRTRFEAMDIAKNAVHSDQAMAAMDLLNPILEQYENRLRKNGEIDFNDMIHRAVEYVQLGKYKPKWKYILVDEFQDVASSRVDLIKALRDRSPECTLFCVGDDWQSIYRFTGSDLNYTTRFGEVFGDCSVTSLDKTYRFNNSICDTASKFIIRNPIQVRKTLHTHTLVESSAVSILRRKNSNDLAHVRSVLARIASLSSTPASVYIICRYKYVFTSAQAKADINALNRDFPSLNIKPVSMHASKGKEADYVIVIGLEKGKHGFPSEKVTHPLLELFLPPQEPFPHAEERRLFYVALTRAKKRAYLVADMTKASSFMTELLKKGAYDLCLDEFESPVEQLEYDALSCPACKTGTLSMRTNSQTGLNFVGCSHFSRCKYTESCCPQCANIMKRKDRFRVCVGCGWKVALCKICPGEMRRRPNGFWGCSNYRGKNSNPTCCHTENRITF